MSSDLHNNYNNNQQPLNRPPKNWLVESILATFFCCLPFGIVGIVYAAKVENLFYAGDIDAAENASREAKKWTMISFFIPIICVAIYLFIFLISIIIAIIVR